MLTRFTAALASALTAVALVATPAMAWAPAEGPLFNNPKGSLAAKYRLQLRIEKAIRNAVPGSKIRISTYLLDRRASSDALINARDHGITPDYTRALRDLGYRLEIQDLVRARDHGVTPDYVKELKSLGYDQLSIDDLIALRDHGVTPDKVKRANARAGSKLPPDMLRSLADGGSL